MTAQRFVTSDGVTLSLDGAGLGLPMLFQHGLCGDAKQTASVFPLATDYARYTLECRGHGQSDAGDTAQFSLAQFTKDVADVIAAENFQRPVVGGISMGAAIALKLAVERPDSVRALVLVRPAWLLDATPPNLEPNAVVGRLLAQHAPEVASQEFDASVLAKKLAAEAPDNLVSLRGFFTRKPAAVTAALLTRISADGMGLSAQQLNAIAMPSLVIGNADDHTHPLSLARDLASLLPNAQFVEVTSKAKNAAAYTYEVQRAIADFLSKDLP
jgi:pimeloyl-ACP methyl ester carboxylesterase